MNIYQKMLCATDKIQKVAKNLTVEVSKGKGYKAVSEVDILEAVKPIEVECGIYSYPYSREVIENAVLESETQYGTRKNLFMRLKIVYRFVNIDEPSEFVDITSYGDGLDSGDKATGKAMTYADKYALMKAYKICTGEDLDAEASTELKSFQKKMCSDNQINLIYKLYSQQEIDLMLTRMNKKSFAEITSDEASKMIEARKGK